MDDGERNRSMGDLSPFLFLFLFPGTMVASLACT